MIRRFAALHVVSILFSSSVVLANDGPAKDVPQLQALSNYIGEWDVKITSDESSLVKGEVTAKWILDGRFLQQSGTLVSADGANAVKIRTLMTYNQDQKAYRMWSFFSNGMTTGSTGQWDADQRTMTSISRSDGRTTTTTAEFVKEGVEKWTIVTRNRNNEVVGEISGTNTLRKK